MNKTIIFLLVNKQIQ